jgi:colanic acid/amylovoran biosynthesis glycosyltransferase
MRIAFVVGEFPALSETFILNQITRLLEQGVEIDIYAERPRRENTVHADVEKFGLRQLTKYENLPENRLNRLLFAPKLWAGFLPKNFRVLLKSLNFFQYGWLSTSLRISFSARPFLTAKPYDILLCHFYTNGQKTVRLREIGAVKGKIVTIIHSFDITKDTRKSDRDFYTELFAKGDLFLPISEYWARYLENQGCPKEKILVHHVGVDCEKFSPKNVEKTDEKFRILSVARLVEKKGLANAVRAVVELKRTNPNDEIEYIIIGDGVLRASLKSLIYELKAENFITLIGEKIQTEVIQNLLVADVVLAPSITTHDNDCEGIPVILMEAMACGLPVISSQHGGIAELVKDKVSGFLVSENDITALKNSLNIFLRNPQQRTEMGKRGREIVVEHFNLAKQNEILLDICRKISGETTNENTLDK